MIVAQTAGNAGCQKPARRRCRTFSHASDRRGLVNGLSSFQGGFWRDALFRGVVAQRGVAGKLTQATKQSRGGVPPYSIIFEPPKDRDFFRVATCSSREATALVTRSGGRKMQKMGRDRPGELCGRAQGAKEADDE
jgi:hypothetical protein